MCVCVCSMVHWSSVHNTSLRVKSTVPLHTIIIVIAYCDVVSHLDCYDWIVKESIRYGDKWRKQWAQEYAKKRLVLELPTILAVYSQPVNKTSFPTWGHYLQEYMIVGTSLSLLL